MTTCPMCAEDIGANDAVCPHCGHLVRTPAAPPSAATHAPVAPSPVSAPSGGAPVASSSSRTSQWIVPGVLAIALVLALLLKFAWWDRRWQGTTEACEVVTALTALHPGSEEIDQSARAYFAGDHDALTRFTRDLAGAISRLQDQGTLRTRGLPAATAEQLYVATLQPRGVTASEAHGMFAEHRREILRAAGTGLRGFQTPSEAAGLRAAASACSSGASPTATTEADAVAPAVAVQPTPASTPLVAPPPPARPTPPATPVTAPATAPERLVPTATSASSFISNGRNQYAADRAFDGDPATTWTEAARGPGDGEWLQATFAGPQLVQRVRITTGWNHTSPRGEDLFTANSHLRRVRLVLGPNTAVERDVGADQREVVFDDLDAETATVRIEALTVWPGTRWADLCLGEVVIEGEPLANGPL